MRRTGSGASGSDTGGPFGSREKIFALLEAAFGTGDAETIALVLDDIARAHGLEQEALTARSDFILPISTLKAFGLKLAVKAA